MWFMAQDTRTGEVLEVPEVSAMMSFEALPEDFPVWATGGDGRPRITPRRFLARIV